MKRFGASLPWLVAALWVGAATVWVARDPRMARVGFPAHSVHSTAADGLSLAYGYLRERAGRAGAGRAVGVLVRPVEQSGPAAGTVLFRIAPQRTGLSELAALLGAAGRRRGGKPEPKPGKGDESAPAAGEDDADDTHAPPGADGRKDDKPADAAPEKGGDADDEDQEEDEDKDGGEAAAAERARQAHARSAAAELLTPAEEEWVEGGGRMVLAIAESWGPLESVALVGGSDAGAAHRVNPWPPTVAEIDVVGGRALAGPELRRMATLFAAGEQAVACRRKSGAGEIVVLSCPGIFENAHLGESGHLALLEALAGGARRVLFDERAHGLAVEVGVLDLLRGWGLGPHLAALAVLGACLFWRANARLGPREDDYRETRREAVEFVDSVAQLYGRALSRREGLALYYKGLAHEVAIRTGLRDAALEKRVQELTGGVAPPPARARGDVGGAEFARILKALNEAYRKAAT
ncbi:MAG: hypothetical protein HZA54_20375 [Planctomycetes bacterium]|nr:hypothetical protein [Planctomycetota bacterium]